MFQARNTRSQCRIVFAGSRKAGIIYRQHTKSGNKVALGSRLVAAAIRIDVQVGLLAVGAFAVGTDSFVIAGLLPDLATAYHVGLPAAGQLVTAYALSLAIFAPMLATSPVSFRAKVLVVGLLIFALANLAGALATHFAEALLARGCAGLGAGLLRQRRAQWRQN